MAEVMPAKSPSKLRAVKSRAVMAQTPNDPPDILSSVTGLGDDQCARESERNTASGNWRAPQERDSAVHSAARQLMARECFAALWAAVVVDGRLESGARNRLRARWAVALLERHLGQLFPDRGSARRLDATAQAPQTALGILALQKHADRVGLAGPQRLLDEPREVRELRVAGVVTRRATCNLKRHRFTASPLHRRTDCLMRLTPSLTFSTAMPD